MAPTPRKHARQPFSSSPLPPWLAKSFEIGFNEDDVAALIGAIESSQNRDCPVTHLPTEILLHILEFVPVEYILDWRFVCRGFRDAIDGRLAYAHLQQIQLIGYIGPRSMWPLTSLSEELYDRMQFLYANFHHVEDVGTKECGRWNLAAKEGQSHPSPVRQGERCGESIWSRKHAVFRIDFSDFGAKPHINDAGQSWDSTIAQAETIWQNATRRLGMLGDDEGYGTLKWCVKLDHAVQDLDLPLRMSRPGFDIAVDLNAATIKVAWKDMLFQFFKTESALRRMTEDV
jgi:hypothetical protein